MLDRRIRKKDRVGFPQFAKELLDLPIKELISKLEEVASGKS